MRIAIWETCPDVNEHIFRKPTNSKKSMHYRRQKKSPSSWYSIIRETNEHYSLVTSKILHPTPIILSQTCMTLSRCYRPTPTSSLETGSSSDILVTESPGATYPLFVNKEESRKGRARIVDIQIDSFAVISCVIPRATIIHKHKFSLLASDASERRVQIGKRGHTWGMNHMKKEYSLKALRWSGLRTHQHEISRFKPINRVRCFQNIILALKIPPLNFHLQ